MNWAELPVSQDRSRNKLLAMRAYTEVGRFVIELPLCAISLASSQAPVVRNVISSPRDIVILDVNATGFLGQPRFPGKKQHLIHVWIGRRPTGHIKWKLLVATSQQWLWGFVIAKKNSEVTLTEPVQKYVPPIFENTYELWHFALNSGVDSALLTTTNIVFKILCKKLGFLPVNTPTPWQSSRVKTMYLDIGWWQMPNVFLPGLSCQLPFRLKSCWGNEADFGCEILKY